MKKTLINFILWFYINHIKEDWDDYTKIGKKVLYPFWFVKSFFVWILIPFYIPYYMFTNSKLYKQIVSYQSSSPSVDDLRKLMAMNKHNMETFLQKKYGKPSRKGNMSGKSSA